MKTIKQLEQEKYDILAKANALVDACEQGDPQKMKTAIEALKPELEQERLRAWANVYHDGGGIALFQNQESAKFYGERVMAKRIAVPMIEIVPFDGEVPTWEGWRAFDGPNIIKQGERELYRLRNLSELCEVHNKEMKRLQSFIDKLLAERSEA